MRLEGHFRSVKCLLFRCTKRCLLSSLFSLLLIARFRPIFHVSLVKHAVYRLEMQAGIIRPLY